MINFWTLKIPFYKASIEKQKTKLFIKLFSRSKSKLVNKHKLRVKYSTIEMFRKGPSTTFYKQNNSKTQKSHLRKSDIHISVIYCIVYLGKSKEILNLNRLPISGNSISMIFIVETSCKHVPKISFH